MSNEHTLKDLLPLLELDEFISFDLETTGLNPDKDKITEIAACRFINGEFTEKFTTLINPGIPIPKNITALTGITNKMVLNQQQLFHLNRLGKLELHQRHYLGLLATGPTIV